MRYQWRKTDSFHLIPIKGLGELPVAEEQTEFKQIINTIVHMNAYFTDSGKIREGKEWIYRDEPNLSYKLYKQNNKIHQYVSFPQDQTTPNKKKKLLRPLLQASVLTDAAQSCRLVPEDFELTNEHLHAFSIQGLAQYAINLDQNFHQQIKTLMKSTGKDDLLYSLTVKEVTDHQKKRAEILDLLAGKDPAKRHSLFNQSKEWIVKGAKVAYKAILDEEEIEKHRNARNRLKQTGQWWKDLLRKKEDVPESTKRKLSDSNQYMQVEILFLLWTDSQDKAQRFQTTLQKFAKDIQGDNQLEVIPVKPDLKRVQKGQLQYDVVPQLCMYQKELSQILYMPKVNEIDETFYYEQVQKTQVPEIMLKNKIGSLAFGKDLYSDQVIYMPRPGNETELDKRVKATLAVGEQGSGKTSYLENQILETYLGGATNEKEWRIYGRSVIAFEVADGALVKNVRQHIPEWAQQNVIILNHADVENPLHVGFHDVLKVNKKSRSIKKQIADTETKILMDSIGDDSKTFAVERHFKAALQASYEVGKGNLIDALKMLKDEEYLQLIIERLIKKGKRNLVEILEDNAADMENDQSVLKTIKNRLVPFMMDEDFVNLVAQDDNPDIDFWKWTNEGPYLVLIYLPGSGQEISLELRKFLFTHYFVKLWMLMLARERIEKNKRKECLVIVDELHQVLGQRAIQNLFGALFKEPRKYRFRFVFSIHGWSSFDEAGSKKKDLIKSIENARPNLVLLKGGNDFFKSMADMLAPYELEDFKELMNMKYCGIFRIDVSEQTHIFRAKLIEPVNMRYPIHQKLSLEKSRSMINKLGRSLSEVEAMIYKKQETVEEETECQEKTARAENNLEEAIDQEFEALTKG